MSLPCTSIIHANTLVASCATTSRFCDPVRLLRLCVNPHLCVCELVCLQNGSGWGRGTADSARRTAEGAAASPGGGAPVRSLPAHLQGSPQVYPLQLHGAVWGFAARQVDNLLHGGEVRVDGCTLLLQRLRRSMDADTGQQQTLLNLRNICGLVFLLVADACVCVFFCWVCLGLYVLLGLRRSTCCSFTVQQIHRWWKLS